jgi:hypothetical protein
MAERVYTWPWTDRPLLGPFGSVPAAPAAPPAAGETDAIAATVAQSQPRRLRDFVEREGLPQLDTPGRTAGVFDPSGSTTNLGG